MGKVEKPSCLFWATLEGRHDSEQWLSNEESGMSKCGAVKSKVLDRHYDEKRKKAGRSSRDR